MAGFVDLELDDEDKLDSYRPLPMDMPDYPCGLRICLNDRELKKLGLESSAEHGDYLIFKAMARVTSSTESDGAGGEKQCRVELQIEKIALIDNGEDDNDEDDEDDNDEDDD
jgi:hypothetical protein